MTNVKTAISLPKLLFEEAEAIAQQLKVSRSRLMALALEEFIRRHQNQQMLEQINAVYEDGLDQAESAVLQGMQHQHRQIVTGEW